MLVALWDVSNQFNDNNGSILTNGKIYVYYSGRAALAPTWSSADGSHVNSNPIILDNNGRAVAFADDQYTYTCVVCDFYGRELFSFDPASFGTGGGGSTTEGNDAAHWIGASGTEVQVTALADTLLPLPSSPDYEGDFVGQTTYTTISLNKGLYMVDADIRIQQDDDDLENIIKDISVYTGLTGPDSLTTSQKNWTGPEASDDRHFVHVHFIRHIADEGEDLYFQMNSPVDLSSAWIDKLSIVKLTEGGNGKNYVGGYGIDITGPVISVSGMIPEASAANFVDVSTYDTDIENIYETIAETSAMIPSGVATEQFVEDYTSAFITEDALDGYATQQWVEDQNYITSADIPPIPQDVVTSGDLATVSGDIVSQIPSLDGYATQNWVEDQHYITSADIPDIPEDVVTSAELASTSAELESMIPSLDGYATEQFVEDYTSAFITESDIPADLVTSGELATVSGEIVNQIPSLDGYATEEYVQDSTSAFITEDALDGYATQQWVGDQGYLTSIPAEYATSGDLVTLSGAIENDIPDTSDMATKTWVGQQGYLRSVPPEYATSGDLATVSGRLSTVSTRYQTYFYPTETNYQKLRFNYGSGMPSSAANAQRLVEVGNGSTYTTIGELVPVPSTSGLVLTSLNGNMMSWQKASGGSEVDIIPSIQTGTKIADYVIDGTSGELYAPNGGSTYTAGDNISIVSDTISVSGTTGLIAGDNISITASGDNYVISSTGGGGGVDQVYHDGTLTGDGTQADPLSITSADIWNAAAGMNEYPISAGPGMSIEDVDGVTVFQTSGTMMDDLIEYNSQDEISGYNGHPVMTVDSEKQWLTHDDTIAHVTNSAQYAFGVNVPVVAQAMGTDETELWSSSALASSAALSEPLTNFDFIELYTRSSDKGYQAFKYTAVEGPVNLTYFKGNNYPVMIMSQITFSGSTVTVSRTLGLTYTWGSTNIPSAARANNTDDMKILIKVVGIGRKENT